MCYKFSPAVGVMLKGNHGMTKRKIFGFLVAPVLGAATFMVLIIIFGEDNTPKQEFSSLEAWPYFVFMFVAVTVVGYIAGIVIGVPLVLLLGRINRLSLWLLTLLSLPIGALIFSILLYILIRNESNIVTPLLIFAGYGAIIAAVVSAAYGWITGITNKASRNR